MSLKTARLVLISLILPQLAVASNKPKPSALVRNESSGQISYVACSSQKVCQLIGEDDKEFGVLTLSQTETRFGFIGSDNLLLFLSDIVGQEVVKLVDQVQNAGLNHS